MPHIPAGPNDPQASDAQGATRAPMFVEADQPAIGLMCFVAAGMAIPQACIPRTSPSTPAFL
ncbi:hypothetical protein PO883_13885 [Massilia sp. DJPM01]|uniref:hypothetical protein n=1 Tax=Massilia sp. DJPM01 TaxID=3024404 RepID=UPI00259EAA97|nr:hypothetical protein [Massilia sp. DJPM01]MDM5178284.1 hypothetical protein [Massilia sp. DJPM01]